MAWPLHGCEAGGDVVVIQTSLFVLCKSWFLMLTRLRLNEKSREVCIKARSPPVSRATTGQVTKHTTVKWPFYDNSTNSLALIGLFLSSISGQTHEYIFYAMRQRARADNLTVCYRNKQMDVSFSCACPDNEFRHNIVNSWSITGQTPEKLTSICWIYTVI